MKLALSVVASSGGSWAEVTEHGLFRDQLEPTDNLSFSNKNLEGDQQVVVFIKESADAAPKMLVLSKRLSKIARKALAQGAKKMEIMKALLNLKVIENKTGYFLVPDGTPSENATLAELTKEEPKEKVTLEQLIA